MLPQLKNDQEIEYLLSPSFNDMRALQVSYLLTFVRTLWLEHTCVPLLSLHRIVKY